MPDPSRPSLDDFDDLERQYNPRVAVPDAAAIIAGWAARGAAARAARAPQTLSYGADPRETIELHGPAAARGQLIFIHGGYWRSLATSHFSWLAAPWTDAGVRVALVEYPLCPQVEVADIVACVRRALAAIAAASEPTPTVLSGHSAGGYLAAAMMADPPPGADFAGVLSLSGVFDPAPLMRTSINDDIRLTPASARALDLLARRPGLRAPLTLAVGADEPAAFHRQSDALASAWAELAPERIDAGTNHFDIVEALAERGSAIARRIEGWIAAQPR